MRQLSTQRARFEKLFAHATAAGRDCNAREKASRVCISSRFLIFTASLCYATCLRQERNYIVVLLSMSLAMLSIPIYHEYNLPIW